MKDRYSKAGCVVLIGMTAMALLAACAPVTKQSPALSQSYSGPNGTLEIGGPFVAAEFHRSRPLPSRISFYTPVANSLDPSGDYWKRDEAVALHLKMRSGVPSNNRIQSASLDTMAFDYVWTPASATFHSMIDELPISLTYSFGDSLPFMAMTIEVVNVSKVARSIGFEMSLDPRLRTSHTYEVVPPFESLDDVLLSRMIYLSFPNKNAGDANLMIVEPSEDRRKSWFRFSYGKNRPFLGELNEDVAPGDTLRHTLLIGTDTEANMARYLQSGFEGWEMDQRRYNDRIERAALNGPSFETGDLALEETLLWSRAMIEANQHHLNGEIVPMPCPAQYNFYFTHDVLVTDLGVVRSDLDRVSRDLRFLQEISTDTLLAHAYYFKDGDYVTEFCAHDSWNHFWFIQLAASYLRHGGDRQLILELLPILEASRRAIESQHGDGDNLAYGMRPDWWDLGNVPGARSYLTSHLIRAQQEYDTILLLLDLTVRQPRRPLEEIRLDLESKLWSEEHGYLMNTIADTIDHHLYSGSLLAAAYGLLSEEKANRLVDTASNVLLDQNLGIRNAMPPDFHLLEREYRFNGPEAGGPWLYMNGAVWPQGNAWYALAQLAVGRPDDALQTVKKYMTLEGIKASPNGQSAFYEFRHSDPAAQDYGRIEKPTFLWAGGWYIHCLYALAGVRESASNIALDPNLPEGFENSAFEMTLGGGMTAVRWSGTGTSVSSIEWDGEPVPSLVLYGNPSKVELRRGAPTQPYLGSLNAVVDHVEWDAETGGLAVALLARSGRDGLTATTFSPTEAIGAELEGMTVEVENEVVDGGFRSTVRFDLPDALSANSSTLTIQFAS